MKYKSCLEIGGIHKFVCILYELAHKLTDIDALATFFRKTQSFFTLKRATERNTAFLGYPPFINLENIVLFQYNDRMTIHKHTYYYRVFAYNIRVLRVEHS